MQPLGRKKIKIPNAKHHPKENGAHLVGWWEVIAEPSKKRARRDAKKIILDEAHTVMSATGRMPRETDYD
ncbi:hypothetical protein [Neptuniibacter sp. QD37_11]|uniref:hypothetical protein n=1 Tax=Neptuniibacter sp. QD37_11 TaxID=3398209 RepID=UPI0039F4D293